MQLIAYYRVSTQRQGQSGLGLEAQRTRIQEIAAARGTELIAEFTETESGRKNSRPQLDAALQLARETGATVVIAKLDRLARDAEFILRLSREAQSNGMGGFLFADMPDLDATTSAGRMILTVMAAAAEFEARRISERTTDALKAAKERGQALGAHNPAVAAANSSRAAAATAYAKKLSPLVLPMRERGDSLRTIADALTASETPTTEGGVATKWSDNGVKRLLARLS